MVHRGAILARYSSRTDDHDCLRLPATPSPEFILKALTASGACDVALQTAGYDDYPIPLSWPHARPFARRRLTKINARTNAEGLPIGLVITPGQAHDVTAFPALMLEVDCDPEQLLGGFCSSAAAVVILYFPADDCAIVAFVAPSPQARTR
jgi:hypothetical protein